MFGEDKFITNYFKKKQVVFILMLAVIICLMGIILTYCIKKDGMELI